MSVDRRKFVKVAGLTALGMAATVPEKLFGQEGGQCATADTGVCEKESAVCAEPVKHGLPQEHPLTAKRWAMVVDLRICREQHDCEDCILACHKEHNVPDFPDEKDEVKWIWKEHFGHAFHEADHEHTTEELKHTPALLLCNHCDNPPCVKVCPTGATWKREEDGIVMMDWHRCIGCRYCVAGCPYGSRSFNYRDPKPFVENINLDFPTRTRGVVEKCTFCDELLAQGKMPACVEACKYDALAFGDLEEPESKVRKLLHSNFTLRRKPGLGTQPEVYYIV